MEQTVSIQRILFATDFSPYSVKAREHTLLLAERLGASAVVFHAIERMAAIEPDDREMQRWFERLEQKLRRKLDRELDCFRERRVEASGELQYGTPWKAVITYAEENSIDLVVVGSHGPQTREGRFLLGTTSHKIALGSRIPVLIAYAPGVGPDPSTGRH